MLFGRYEIMQKIAQGGMAEVYRARVPNSQFAKSVALKRIYPHLSHDQKYRDLFIQEAKIAASLVHPNIVQVFELGERQGELFIAMEFIEGMDVGKILLKLVEMGDVMPAPAVATIAFDVLDALHYAHNRTLASGVPMDIVHQDISPQNILVGLDGVARLCDFGVARANRATQTLSGAHLGGKIAYMAVEQLQYKSGSDISTHASGSKTKQQVDHSIDGRVDLYSLGVVLYELLTGQRLFADTDLSKLLKRVEHEDIPPLASVRPGVSPVLGGVIDHAVKKSRAQRFQTAKQFQNAIEEFLLTCDPGHGRASLKEYVARWGKVISEKQAPAPRQTTRIMEFGQMREAGQTGRQTGPGTKRWTSLLRRATTRHTLDK